MRHRQYSEPLGAYAVREDCEWQYNNGEERNSETCGKHARAHLRSEKHTVGIYVTYRKMLYRPLIGGQS